MKNENPTKATSPAYCFPSCPYCCQLYRILSRMLGKPKCQCLLTHRAEYMETEMPAGEYLFSLLARPLTSENIACSPGWNTNDTG